MYAKLRRILLVMGIVGATTTWFYVSLDPLVSVELTDFEGLQRHEGDWSQSARILRPLPSDAVIMAKTGGAAIICAGETWISFAEDVIDATHGRFRDSSWTQRVDDSMFHRSPWSVRFYFRPWEHPLNEIADQLHRARGVEQYLQIEMGDQIVFLTVRYQNLASSDFQLGTGLALAPLPLRRFLNPLRPATIWLLLIGFAAYLLLP